MPERGGSVVDTAPEPGGGSVVDAPQAEPEPGLPETPGSGLQRDPPANDTQQEEEEEEEGEEAASAAPAGTSAGPSGEGGVEAVSCWDCPDDASAAVTPDLGDGPGGPVPGDREEAGSGDPPARTTEPGPGAVGPPVPSPEGRPSEPWPAPGGTAAGPPGPRPSPEALDVDYYDGPEGRGPGAAPPRPPPGPAGEPPARSPHDAYDDFTPFDESDFYPTTSFYEDELEEEEEEDEEEEEAAPAGDPEDGDVPRPPAPAPDGRRPVGPPRRTLGGLPTGSPVPGSRPGEPGKDPAPGENGTVCRGGFVRHNGSCRSVCELFPSYCHNGGQCYLVENLGAFCRCNTQDYIWHKGMRCESIITDFQVMCVAVGSAALVLLLLFMMTVFFAKKLYLLKTENSKLRKTKFRTPSELHNDNFSLSTIAEGSHPNVRKLCDTPHSSSPNARALGYYDNVVCQDDPNAPHKKEEALKSCLKEEEPFILQSPVSPKLAGSKGAQEGPEGNCLQNNLT
ncbi:chondroitin sulfate proteoglycan 5 [Ornithorhynchus anatinus]|uniref:chondroitin sulfate proteoglycan 5 n=1 Tax=Ornithorhynchus anatinus TaxID=9258 RepID=UPI0010A8AA5A|nr:chondroitin sulfate proteoglycan 5 [Ornithorhynchus anatinus]